MFSRMIGQKTPTTWGMSWVPTLGNPVVENFQGSAVALAFSCARLTGQGMA